MKNHKVPEERREWIAVLVKTSLLLCIALIFQLGLAPFAQPLVGPAVNMVLLLAVLLLGNGPALLIGFSTPLIAFAVGIMPVVLVVPIIMLGNALYILSFSFLYKRTHRFAALLVAALAKTGVMALTIRLFAYLFLPNLPPRIISALSLPQLYTALMGGFLALLVYRYLPQNRIEK